MSAANWRGANATAGPARVPPAPRVARSKLANPLRLRHLVVLAFLIAYPWFAPPFFTYQIGAQALALGLIALSLTFLGGYGGMVSLAQMTVAGIAGYMVAIFGTSATDGVSLGWPWWLAVVIGIAVATLAAAPAIAVVIVDHRLAEAGVHPHAAGKTVGVAMPEQRGNALKQQGAAGDGSYRQLADKISARFIHRARRDFRRIRQVDSVGTAFDQHDDSGLYLIPGQPPLGADEMGMKKEGSSVLS